MILRIVADEFAGNAVVAKSEHGAVSSFLAIASFIMCHSIVMMLCCFYMMGRCLLVIFNGLLYCFCLFQFFFLIR